MTAPLVIAGAVLATMLAGPPPADSAPASDDPSVVDAAPDTPAADPAAAEAPVGPESAQEAPLDPPAAEPVKPMDPVADPAVDTAADAEATAVAEPAKLVDGAPPAPATPTAAVGAGGQTPLPAAPPAEDPATINPRPWRGRFDVAFQAGAIGPVGGVRPGRGTVASAYGGVGFGVRVHPLLRVGAAVTTFIHDAVQTTVVDPDTGETVAEQGLGRVTLVELGIVRVVWPVAKRIELFGEAAPGLGVRRAPITSAASFAGSTRVGVGAEFWLGPTATLGLDFGYRALFVERTVGHGLQGGAWLGLHW